MKATLVSLALLTAGLAACSSKADLPTIEQVAHAYEAHVNANLSSEMGQRIESPAGHVRDRWNAGRGRVPGRAAVEARSRSRAVGLRLRL
ncbi:hypothetical protein G6F31_021636 [Rhizopus arrhizus]|nr:hypothetical protein G6F31_021636 [Rhizopus arrhizus]